MQLIQECHAMDLFKTRCLPWFICFAASLFFFYEFIQGNMFASIANSIMRDFHIQADKMTYLSSIYYVSNVLFLFIAGMLLDRFSAKRTILIAMLLCVLSTFLLAHTSTFSVALICRFIAGIGSAFCFLGPIRIASRWFPAQKMAFVTGVIVTIAMSGGMLAQYPMTKLVSYGGWRHAVLMVAWLGVGILILMLFGLKEKPSAQVARPSPHLNIRAALKLAYFNPQTLRAAGYASLLNMAVAVFGAVMGTLYLTQRLGVSQERASLVNSMLFLGAIIGGPVMGWWSDRLSLRVMPMKFGIIASLITVLGVLYLPVSFAGMMMLFFCLGFFTATQVISYAFVAESCPASMTATAVSVVSLMTQSGYVVFQNLFSVLLLWHGEMQIINQVPVYSLHNYQTASIMLPLGLGVAWLAIRNLKETHARHV